MAYKVCPKCGALFAPSATECKFCGEKLVDQQMTQLGQAQPVYNQMPQQQPQIIIQLTMPQEEPQQVSPYGIDPEWPVKSKKVAGFLAIFFGTIGSHKFYLGKFIKGLLYIAFSWTAVPTILGVIEGITYLCSSDKAFQLKHHVRID